MIPNKEQMNHESSVDHTELFNHLDILINILMIY